MPRLTLETTIRAGPAACCDLSLTVDAHTESMERSGERAVAGRTSGRLELGEQVTWQARHFALPFRMTVTISELDAPRRFVDEQVRGPFGHWRHEHTFVETAPGVTTMRDDVDFASPLGPVGSLVDRIVLTRHLGRLLEARNRWLRDRLEAA